MENKELLTKVLDTVKNEISTNAYNTWFKVISLERDSNGKIIIYAANEFASDWIRKNYSAIIHNTVKIQFAEDVDILITSKSDKNSTNSFASFL
ncbi:DnaA N-terminal domain-containing protein [Metabacillus malikii]|uniref:Chromosomal replication initiation ATPase DnaA n=1 Tax=Metabacillus malikii TaxID=1504265 RepID=A0ABT9ZE13_9BACI|nr:DnaA N-terminal domain-containing protein [Metabacillus malikii]MDQ0230179.1 chromosomal replication initiation ATPase DnaA [Metabacillus malikii]